ncbi:MAG TPA: TonB-dependent receptor [Burkholderiaceae bacterium]|jgi:iron complex outermembrane receptor protein
MLLAQPSASAQEAKTEQLPEVTVTAERSETILRRTPVSVGVVGQDEIDQRSMYTLSDLAGTIAGVTVPNGFSSSPQAVGIRGVGVSLPAMSQAVALYVDDVPLVRGYATGVWDLPDIARFEVLRGPQGTLYGQNSTAGAVKIVSLDPVASPSAWWQLGAGNYGEKEVKAYAVGALGPGPLSASFAFSHRENDGYAYNATLSEKVNRLNFTQFRTKLRYAPSADFDAVLAVDGLQDRSDTNSSNFPFNVPGSPPRVNYVSSTDGPFKRNAGGVELKLRKAINAEMSFRSITAWRTYHDDPQIGDFGGLVPARFYLEQTEKQNAFSQEFQWQKTGGPLTWTTGLVAVHDDFTFTRYSSTLALTATKPSDTDAYTKLETTDLGAYGQLRYALDALDSVSFGLRAYHTKQTGSNQFWVSDADHDHVAPIYNAQGLSTQKSGVLPRLSLERQFDPDLFGYASVAQGAKFGGFNRAANSLFAAEFPAKPERVTAYEIGGKGRLAGGRATVQLAAFYNDYRDYLSALTNATLNGVQINDTVLLNAGRAKTYGVDLDMAAKLSEHLDWTLSAEVLRTRFDEFLSTASGSNFVGNQLPNASRLSGGSSIRYSAPVVDCGQLSLSASVQYQGAQFADVANTPALRVAPQTYVHLGAAFSTLSSSPWTVSLVVRNALNRTQMILRQIIPSLGVDAGAYNLPRTVVLSVRHDI